VFVFGFYLGGFVVKVCFLFFSVYLRVVYEEGGSRSKIAFYVATFE
jgi:hypothetical protein